MTPNKPKTPRVRKAPLAPEGETKEARFTRLATARMTKAVKALRNVARLSNRTSYSHTPTQIEKILVTLADECKAIAARFSETKAEREQTGFSFD